MAKACRTLDAKRANDTVPKKYQIGTKIGRFFFLKGGGGGSIGNVKYVHQIVRNVPIRCFFCRTHK